MIKSIADAVKENTTVVKNRMSYGQTLEEIPEIDLPREGFDVMEESENEDDLGF